MNNCCVFLNDNGETNKAILMWHNDNRSGSPCVYLTVGCVLKLGCCYTMRPVVASREY